MSIWNKILIGLIFVGSVVFAYMAVRTLQTHKYWRNLAAAHTFFVEKDRQICDVLGRGGDLIISVDQGTDQLGKYYRAREVSISLQQGMEWAEFKKNVLDATKRSGEIDPELLRECTFNVTKIPGNKQLGLELDKILEDRGRVWRECTRKQQPGGPIQVIIHKPVPHGLAEKVTVYVFDEQAGHYLGEFRVAKVVKEGEEGENVDKREVTLEPTKKLTTEESDRLQASKGPWVLYGTMPSDSHDVFAGWDEDKLNKVFAKPFEGREDDLKKVVNEYLHDGKLLTKKEAGKLGLQGKVLWLDKDGEVVCVDKNGEVVAPAVDAQGDPVYLDKDGEVVDMKDLTEREVEDGQKGSYFRPLRDYAVLFDSYYRQRPELLRQIEVRTQDAKYVKDALDDAQQQRGFREKQRDQLTVELKEVERERDAVNDHRKIVKQKVDEWKVAVEQLISSNKATAGQIAKIQLEAARRIDERTRGMARTGAGGD